MLDDLLALDPIDLANPLTQHPLNQGRVLWLLGVPPLDGGRQWYDLCGRNHGTLTNGPTWAATGRGDSGLIFDGTDDFVSLGAIGSLGNLTVACWVSRPTLSGNRWPWVLANFAGLISTSAGNLRVFGIGGVDYTATGALPAGDASRVVVRRSGTSVTTAVNGVVVSSATGTTSAVSATAPKLGQRGDGTEWYQGRQSDFTVAGRAWSDAEVLADYDLSRRGYPSVLRRLRPPVSLLTGGSDVSVALTGAAASAQSGALLPARSVAATGSVSPTATGPLAVTVTRSLAGTAPSAVTGTLSPSAFRALSGSGAAGVAGTITPSRALALAGSEATTPAASLSAAVAVAMSGSSANTQAGTVSPSTGPTPVSPVRYRFTLPVTRRVSFTLPVTRRREF